MNHELKYSGYTTAPSDYECPDGLLTASLNLIYEDGSIVPIPKSTPVFSTPEGYRLMLIHNVSAQTHNYIFLHDGNLYYITNPQENTIDSESLTRIHHGVLGKSYSVSQNANAEVIGNTIVCYADGEMHYILWRQDDTSNTSSYVYLGDHLPELDISFSLSAASDTTECFGEWTDMTFKCRPDNPTDFFKEENQKHIENQLLAIGNKFIADTHNKGYFIFPFFVCYAYRLYDGSLTMQSEPVLMIPSSSAPWLALQHYSSDSTSCQGRAFALPTELYATQTNTDDTNLVNFKDIIASVDIFVSAPIYTYEQNGHGFDSSNFAPYTARGKSTAFGIAENSIEGNNGLVKLTSIWGGNTMNMPYKTKEDIANNIRDVSAFYLLHSIPTEQRILAERIKPGENVIKTLVTRERMTFDYDSHDVISANCAFPYNSRLNLANITKKLYTGARFNRIAQAGASYNGYQFTLFWYLNHNSQNHIVSTPILTDRNSMVLGHECSSTIRPYLYYPSISAYRCVIRRQGVSDNSVQYMSVTLKPHPFFNGAYWMPDVADLFPDITPSSGDVDWFVPDNTITQDPVVTDGIVKLPNKIYTSEVNNPFLFPVTGINTIGNGCILGIASAAKALSQGQFGQFPLYAFTDEGVWAMEVSSNGTFSARQPITRDVILPNTIPLQMDSAVLFATNRGIMQISGSNTTCISELINSEKPFDLTKLPGMGRLHEYLDHTEDTCFPIEPFFEFIKECGMLYDYIHQRVIVYNKKYTYAYVFSLKSQHWGMMHSTLAERINAYPEALAVDHNGYLLNFSSNDTFPQKGLLVTRPIKLLTEGVNGDMLKTIDTIIQRGSFARGHVQTVLYGSRDLKNWFVVWSSKDHYLRGFRGTGYKYFRIALVTSMTEGESIFGASINFNPRQTNQLR